MAERRIEGLAAARLWATDRFPYLATGLFGAEVVAAPDSGTVSVDEGWRMHADPDLVAEWTAAQLGSVLVHHVCHLLRSHGERAHGLGVGPADVNAWVRAADAEINDDLIPAGLELPGRPVLPRDFGAPDGLLAEQYFVDARSTERSAQEDEQPAGTWLDCGSGADGQPRPGDQPPQPEWQAELLRRQVAQEIAAHAKTAGTLPAGLLRWAQDVIAPKVNWRALLSAELRRALAEVSGAVDYSYRRPSRRASVAGAVVLPALRRPVPEIAVVCDTSASMSEDLLAEALAEVDGLLRVARHGPPGPRAGLRHRGRDRPAGQLRPPGRAHRRRRDRHGGGHRGGGRAAAPARPHGGPDRRVHPVAGAGRRRAPGC